MRESVINNLPALGGSTTQRNIPDVALTAQNVWVIYFNGLAGSFEGTSCAAPLWAGYAALVNQQAAGLGKPSVGFFNPALYAISQSPLYSQAFHDVTTGNDFWPNRPGRFAATTGYDLATGWGTPNGQGMINALLTYDQAVWVEYNYGGNFNLEPTIILSARWRRPLPVFRPTEISGLKRQARNWKP